jgi:hypothetical protein
MKDIFVLAGERKARGEQEALTREALYLGDKARFYSLMCSACLDTFFLTILRAQRWRVGDIACCSMGD